MLNRSLVNLLSECTLEELQEVQVKVDELIIARENDDVDEDDADDEEFVDDEDEEEDESEDEVEEEEEVEEDETPRQPTPEVKINFDDIG